jgi:hypothetical protein
LRRHAQRSSAGSTSSQCGSFGIRGALGNGRGSSAPATSRRTLSAVVLTAALALVLGGSVARAAAAPTVTGTSVDAVTGSSAVLGAEIAPEGEATTFHFEYGAADCAANPCTAISPDGSVGSGGAPVAVSRELLGLQPGTTYHFRVVATNGSGETAGPDRRFTTSFPTPAQSCANAAFRTGVAATLPNCRAYEMVSPVDKNGADIETLCAIGALCASTSLTQVAPDGEKITYTSYKAFGDQPASVYANQYIATRDGSGWSTHGVNPPHHGNIFPEFSFQFDLDTYFKAFTADLGTTWLLDTSKPTLTPAAVEDEVNLYRQDNLSGTLEALTTDPPPPGFERAFGGIGVKGFARDGSHLVVQADAPLTPDAPFGGVFQYANGSWHRVSVLPDGTPSEQGSVGSQQGTNTPGREGYVLGAVSVDGSRIVWRAEAGELYVRKNPEQPQSAFDGGGKCTEPAKACTILVVDVPAEAKYLAADGDVSNILFSLGGGEGDLIKFDVDSETSTLVAQEVPGAIGASEDLSRVYFVSAEALAPGAVAGDSNLYLDEGGTKRFIAKLTPRDVKPSTVFGGNVLDPIKKTAQVAPDGRTVVFASESKELSELVAGYDNTDAVSGKPDSELYVYEADGNGGQGKLVCASCNPTGVQPHGQPRPWQARDYVVEDVWAAAWLKTAENMLTVPNDLTDDGSRLFFNSRDALVPRDTNGAVDVYQWEAQGSGGCSRDAGCISLISSGESAEPSEFMDASPDGRDVFFKTTSSLLPQDSGLIDIYDARVGGGYPPPTTTAACEGEACQSPPPPPNDPTPASASYNGPGNVTSAAKKKKHKKQHKRKHKKKQRGHGSHKANATHRNG